MADHIVCGDRMQEAVIKSLIEKNASGDYGMRTVQKTRDTSAEAIACNSMQTFLTLLTQCIEIGTDNKPVLRLVITAAVSGAGLTSLPDCGQYEELDLMLSKCFCKDTNGDICFQLWNIT